MDPGLVFLETVVLKGSAAHSCRVQIVFESGLGILASPVARCSLDLLLGLLLHFLGRFRDEALHTFGLVPKLWYKSCPSREAEASTTAALILQSRQYELALTVDMARC
jgi:hypothetical protein